MCGGCDGLPSFPLVKGQHDCCSLGLHVSDNVWVRETEGATEQLGFFEDLDSKWGVAIVWTDGSRTWFPYSRWCPEVDDGWNIRLANPEEFVRGADFVAVPPEHGRGWLPRPPARKRQKPRVEPPSELYSIGTTLETMTTREGATAAAAADICDPPLQTKEGAEFDISICGAAEDEDEPEETLMLATP